MRRIIALLILILTFCMTGCGATKAASSDSDISKAESSDKMAVTERQGFVYAFFPFLFGVYPYTVVTDKQKEAMQDAGVDYTYQSVYELIYACVLRLL